MTAKEAIYFYTDDDDHEKNHRIYPLLAKAFDDIRAAENIPYPFKKWLIALGCPDDAGQMRDAVKVTSSLLVGLLESFRTGWCHSDPWLSELMRELIDFAKPMDEQVFLMRQAMASIEENLEQSASTEPITAVESPAS
jgi:hypothetical protein